jgi:hypothetical protein
VTRRFDLAIDSKLRRCDPVKIKIGDVVSGAEIRTRLTVIQQKTGRPVQFEITADVRASLLSWLERRGGSIEDYAFPSRVDDTGHLSMRQYVRLVDEWVTAIGLKRAEYGTHSLRRTKASMIYKATGNLRAIQILLGGPSAMRPGRSKLDGYAPQVRSFAPEISFPEAAVRSGRLRMTAVEPLADVSPSAAKRLPKRGIDLSDHCRARRSPPPRKTGSHARPDRQQS